MNLTLSQQQADQYLTEGKYGEAINLYEQAIEVDPKNQSYYWYLGLFLLLQDREMEAQATWMTALAEVEVENIEIYISELVEILEKEAIRQTSLSNYKYAWVIHSHIREIAPDNINNLLYLIDLSIQLEIYTGQEISELRILELLQPEVVNKINQDLLFHVLRKILVYAPHVPLSLEFISTCLPYVKNIAELANVIVGIAYNMQYLVSRQDVAIALCETCLKVLPENFEILLALTAFYTDIEMYQKSIEYGKNLYAIPDNPIYTKVYVNHLIIRAMMLAGGYEEELAVLFTRHKFLLEGLTQEIDIQKINAANLIRLYSTTFFFPYLQDLPAENLRFRCQVSEFCQTNIQAIHPTAVQIYTERNRAKKINYVKKSRLRIGYLSHCLRKHSVGWLSMCLFKYHNHEQFEIFTYLLAAEQKQDDLLEWYVQKSDKAHKYDLKGFEVAEQISEDQIDILIDLDSLTLSSACEIMAMKSAPIQATWLGWDAPGMSAIDYFIADPYVLPENAQDYYQEKIWRLPETYIAVEGFEVDVPNLHRQDIDIPSDAVIYFTAQKGPKYNRHMTKLQMQILREVPNSYFLIKGFSQEEKFRQFFVEIAEANGLPIERLRFIPQSESEQIHRANLQIADVVLDTYPYNGATTTMETLWMCIPMVTRVGEQFVARNSYTMMINAGITEGIAWTDEEYVEWGIKLGRNENLRQEIYWKLRKNRQTAPLWNAQQFTQNMENAYQQMWEKYLRS